MQHETRFCTHCATPLQRITQAEDGGQKERLRCPACGWTHWNNPTPVLAAVIECADRDGQLLLARNAAWPGRFFGLVTGFMEAGETPQEGIAREVAEETALQVTSLALIGVYDFQRMNQLIVAYHAQAQGDITQHRRRVGQRLDAVGVDCIHLLDQLEKAIELGQHALGFVGAQFKPRQIGDSCDFLGCQCHE